MIEKNDSQNLKVLARLLVAANVCRENESGITITPLTGDGSSRKFWRISRNGRGVALAVAPPTAEAADMAEATSARAIGLHLLAQGVRVPEQYGWDAEYGMLLFEDLGDCKLHDSVLEARANGDTSGIRHLYGQVVRSLVLMQVRGREGFDSDWCWDTPRYDRTLMLERESGYFLRAFWEDFLGREKPSGLGSECIHLANQAGQIPADSFLHRDFQSRNIMLHRGEVCFIDFQGGRLGPLGYDLASLLIDPYTALSSELQEELLEEYLDALEKLVAVDRSTFKDEYLLLALQRNLQIVGAFAFLAKQRGKVFFRQFLYPALCSLDILLGQDCLSEMVVLRKTVGTALVQMKS